MYWSSYHPIQQAYSERQSVCTRRRRIHSQQRPLQSTGVGNSWAIRIHQGGGYQEPLQLRGGKLYEDFRRNRIRANVQAPEVQIRSAPGDAEGTRQAARQVSAINDDLEIGQLVCLGVINMWRYIPQMGRYYIHLNGYIVFFRLIYDTNIAGTIRVNNAMRITYVFQS